MKMKKEALNAEGGSGGPKYEQAAKGASLPKGVSHYMGDVDMDGSIPRRDEGTTQRPVKGHDRIG